MIVTRKKVKVLTNGPIRAKGWVYGPILNPYMESTKIIFAMLRDSIKVVEVLNNGSELVLNATNFDKNNNIGLVEDDSFTDELIPVSLSLEEEEAQIETQAQSFAKIETVDENVMPVEESALVDEKPVNHNKKNKK